jgi:hypothetical protein
VIERRKQADQAVLECGALPPLCFLFCSYGYGTPQPNKKLAAAAQHYKRQVNGGNQCEKTIRSAQTG